MSRARKVTSAALAAVLSILLIACSNTPQSPQTVSDVSSLVALKLSYIDAKDTLIDHLDTLPEEVALTLLDLEVEADQLVDDYTAAWSDETTTLGDLEVLLQRTNVLYRDAVGLIYPHMGDLSLSEQRKLQRVSAAWRDIQAAYEQWRELPDSDRRREVAIAGLKLATKVIGIF